MIIEKSIGGNCSDCCNRENEFNPHTVATVDGTLLCWACLLYRLAIWLVVTK